MKTRKSVANSACILMLCLTTLLLLSACAPDAASWVRSWTTIAQVETSGRTAPVQSLLPGDLDAPTAGSLCPEIKRPALLLHFADETYGLFDPAPGALCSFALPAAVPGLVAMAGDSLFQVARTRGPEGAATVIRRQHPDGTVEALPYTLVDSQSGTALVAFAVSNDASRIAWSVVGPGGDGRPTTSLTVADLATGAVLGGVAPEGDPGPRVLEPIRFSEDGSVLFYALQPHGLGGIWSSFVARYDNLHALPVAGGAPTAIFACADHGLGLCLGDFDLAGNRVAALAYVDRTAGSIVIQDGAGAVLDTFEGRGAYVGYPTWGPGSQLVFYSADPSADPAASPLPSMGYLQWVERPGAPARTLAAAPGLGLPLAFLDPARITVLWNDAEGNRGLALAGVDGSVRVLDLPPGSILLTGGSVAPVVSR